MLFGILVFVFTRTNFRRVQKKKHSKHRNSAQLIVEANNVNVKTKIEKFETLEDGGETCKNLSPCSIVVTEAEDEKADETDKNANRLSIVSNSSVESSRSDNNEDEAVNVGQGSSVFYVVWD